jgi:hypothetical protein
MRLGLRVGELVEVRSEGEILATLDANGAVDGLPFMPEMLGCCGKRFRVGRRADKTCDTIDYTGSRRLLDTVHLEGVRCDGQAHGECQARCLLFWKEAWLRRVERLDQPTHDLSGTTEAIGLSSAAACDRRRLAELTRSGQGSSDGEVRYRCQATDLLRASSPLAWWDVRQYVRDVRSGNVPVRDVVGAVLFRVFRVLLRFRGYRALMWSYNQLQSWRGRPLFPSLEGALDRTPRATLDLRPGELVQIKSREEIAKTLDRRNRNHGLSFDVEMLRYCGGVHRVLARVERIIDERSGRMITLANDCILLEGTGCRAEYSGKRLFCPRSIYPFWREIWLKRVEGAVACEASPTVVSDLCTGGVRSRD